MMVQDILNASSYIDKFHFIKDSKLPALNPKKNEEQQLEREVREVVMDDQEQEMEVKNE